MKPNPTLLPLLLLAFAPSLLPAWGRDGHAIVAAVAEARLTTPTLTQVRAILGPGTTMAEVSVWADEVRRDRPDSAPWHYVNFHIREDVFDPAQCPNGDCVTLIIPKLRSRVSKEFPNSPMPRREAMMYLIHFVGDQAQPLHNANEDDLGGNTKKVDFFGAESNLHAIWDTKILQRHLKDRALSAEEFARELDAEIRPEQCRVWLQGDTVTWSNDGHRVAIEFCYPGWSPTITQEYYTKSIGTVRVQLQKGGVRLAHLLNQTFDPEYKTTSVSYRPAVITDNVPFPEAAPFKELTKE